MRGKKKKEIESERRNDSIKNKTMAMACNLSARPDELSEHMKILRERGGETKEEISYAESFICHS